MRVLRDTLQTVRTSPGFTLALVITLVAAAFNGLMVLLMALRLEALLPGAFAQMAHFTEPRHRTHDLTFSFLFVPALVGIVAQFRRPSRNIAAMVMALVPSVALLLTVLLTFVIYSNGRTLQPPWLMVMAGAIIALALHPAGRDFFRSFTRSRISPVLLALTIVAAAPLLAFAIRNLGLQGTVLDDHAAPGHYGFMTAFALTVIGVSVLASLRPDGWGLAAWTAGFLPALLGVTSLAYPDATSSLRLPWALAALAWGVLFIATGELTKDARLGGVPAWRQVLSRGTRVEQGRS
jgi:putative effector of murein hydrolase LrgA (UPF0299 family)